MSQNQGTDVTGIHTVSRYRLEDGPSERSTDSVIEECPVALVYNGISHAVMMATPVNLEDFALGFSLSEGILTAPSQLLGVEVTPADAGYEIHLEILTEPFAALKQRRRYMSGRSGCGLCGKESLEQALMPLPRLADTPKPSLGAIQKAVNSLRGLQPIQQQTSASHAAVWCDAEGNLGLLREDVGRHNALDKLIGALAGQRRNSAPPNAASQSGFVLITSRASYEIVAKTAIAGVGSLVALSAPTSLAVETALRCNLNLIAFAGAAPMVYAESTACSP